MFRILTFLLLSLLAFSSQAQELFFADFFDIKINTSQQKAVNGKIHLKRNKDVLTTPVPSTYYFEIVEDNSKLFDLSSSRENVGKMEGMLIGELSVKERKVMPSIARDFSLLIALKDGNQTLSTKKITIHVVEKTLKEHLTDFYAPVTIQSARLFGRKKPSDQKVQALMEESTANDGALFSVSPIYSKSPEEINKVEDEWEKIADTIGTLGYAYANSKSKFYKSEQLRRAIYKSARAYMNLFPVFGDDIQEPWGNEVGDGLQGLSESNHVSHGFVTHQWRGFDGLGAPLVQINEELTDDLRRGDADAMALQEASLRFYQAFFSITPGRRVMNDKLNRWQDISDSHYSEGAWADANISHRMRTLMVMGIVWNDYNRPITYVPYWYDDYYNGTEFDGLTFAKAWSPRGIIYDIRYWCSKFSVPSHHYGQSGFHPDGTVSHHSGEESSDMAMVAYGFEWLEKVNVAIKYFQHSTLPIEDGGYQFIVDRLNYTYRRMIYKQQLDYVTAGRSFYSDLHSFATKSIPTAIADLIDGKSATTFINNENELKNFRDGLINNTHKHSESVAFWNTDYLIHRRENQEGDFFFSVKQKSIRSSGAEDFDKPRKSWHAGSGVFQLKTDGDEYSQAVLSKYDWHTLPGVTEEWRTDAMPLGRASAAGAGLSHLSGVLANGRYATSAFVYDPSPEKIDKRSPRYASATAHKSYHMIGRYGIALGSDIKRKDAGQGKEIVTGLDQAEMHSTLYYSVNGGEVQALKPNSSHDLRIVMDGPTWLFHNNKGYIVVPQAEQELIVKSGSYINVTDDGFGKSKNYIIAINHGVEPSTKSSDGYQYVLVANAALENMPAQLHNYLSNYQTFVQPGALHGVYSLKDKLTEIAFYKPGTVYLNADKSEWVDVNKPALIIKEELENRWILSVTDPMHDINSETIQIKVPQKLVSGKYHYSIQGLESIDGEFVTVTSSPEGTIITIELPDKRDAEKYNYKEKLLAGAPIIVEIPTL